MLTHRQIEAFRAVMLSRSFTAAGQTLSVTQSAISKIVAELEGEIGFALFSRRRGGLEPTAEAQALLKEVDRSYHGIERIQRSAERIRHGQEGALRIAAIPALGTGFAQGVLADFLKEHGRISVTLETFNTNEILDLVAGGFCDLGFAMTPVNTGSVIVESILSVRCVGIVPSGHRLAEKECLDLADFEGEPFISLAENTTTRLKVDAAFNAINVSRSQWIETRWSASVCGFVARNLGLSIIEPFTTAALARLSFEVRPIADKIEFSFAAIIPKHKPLGRLEKDFCRKLMGCAERFI